jgi:hypothetical protein
MLGMFKKIIYQVYMLQFPSFKPGHVKAPPKPLPKPLPKSVPKPVPKPVPKSVPKPVPKPVPKLQPEPKCEKVHCMANAVTYLMTK